LESYHFAFKG